MFVSGVADDAFIGRCYDEMDSVWDTMWSSVAVNSRDGQFCPGDRDYVTGKSLEGLH